MNANRFTSLTTSAAGGTLDTRAATLSCVRRSCIAIGASHPAASGSGSASPCSGCPSREPAPRIPAESADSTYLFWCHAFWPVSSSRAFPRALKPGGVLCGPSSVLGHPCSASLYGLQTTPFRLRVQRTHLYSFCSDLPEHNLLHDVRFRFVQKLNRERLRADDFHVTALRHPTYFPEPRRRHERPSVTVQYVYSVFCIITIRPAYAGCSPWTRYGYPESGAWHRPEVTVFSFTKTTVSCLCSVPPQSLRNCRIINYHRY